MGNTKTSTQTLFILYKASPCYIHLNQGFARLANCSECLHVHCSARNYKHSNWVIFYYQASIWSNHNKTTKPHKIILLHIIYQESEHSCEKYVYNQCNKIPTSVYVCRNKGLKFELHPHPTNTPPCPPPHPSIPTYCTLVRALHALPICTYLWLEILTYNFATISQT